MCTYTLNPPESFCCNLQSHTITENPRLKLLAVTNATPARLLLRDETPFRRVYDKIHFYAAFSMNGYLIWFKCTAKVKKWKVQCEECPRIDTDVTDRIFKVFLLCTYVSYMVQIHRKEESGMWNFYSNNIAVFMPPFLFRGFCHTPLSDFRLKQI